MASQTDELLKRREYRAGQRTPALKRGRSLASQVRLPEPPNNSEPEDSESENPEDEEEDDDSDGQQSSEEEGGSDQGNSESENEGPSDFQGGRSEANQSNEKSPETDDERSRELRRGRNEANQSNEKSPETESSSDQAEDGSEKSPSRMKALLNRFRQGRKSEGFEEMSAAGAQFAKEVAEAAYRAWWKELHELAEDSAFDLWMIPFYSMIPVTLATLRFFIGNVVGRFWTIHFAGAEVALVPSIKADEAPRRAGINAILLVLAFVWWAIFAIIIYVSSGKCALDPTCLKILLQLGTATTVFY